MRFFLILANSIVGTGKMLVTVSLKYLCIFKLKKRFGSRNRRTHNAKSW
jgi:hypothetical protein